MKVVHRDSPEVNVVFLVDITSFFLPHMPELPRLSPSFSLRQGKFHAANRPAPSIRRHRIGGNFFPQCIGGSWGLGCSDAFRVLLIGPILDRVLNPGTPE